MNIKYVALSIMVSILLISCSKEEKVSTIVEETSITESIEESNVYKSKNEQIDFSDITDENIRNTLYKINELNQSLGDVVYLSKEDYFDYADTNVSIVGDSISDMSSAQLKKYFKNFHQDSVSGREMELGIDAFDNMKKMGNLGDIFILSLGNNATKGIDNKVLEHVYKGLEGRPLIIPTIVMPYYGQERNRNRDLINFVNTHENCYIADWNKVARMNEAFIVEDGVHPTPNGSYAYSQLMYKTVVDIVKSQKMP